MRHSFWLSLCSFMSFFSSFLISYSSIALFFHHNLSFCAIRKKTSNCLFVRKHKILYRKVFSFSGRATGILSGTKSGCNVYLLCSFQMKHGTISTVKFPKTFWHLICIYTFSFDANFVTRWLSNYFEVKAAVRLPQHWWAYRAFSHLFICTKNNAVTLQKISICRVHLCASTVNNFPIGCI